jgi:hypothetical protein
LKPLIDKAVDAPISSVCNSVPNGALNDISEPHNVRLTLTPKATLGFFFIQRYRYLTITQVAPWGFYDPHV